MWIYMPYSKTIDIHMNAFNSSMNTIHDHLCNPFASCLVSRYCPAIAKASSAYCMQ